MTSKPTVEEALDAFQVALEWADDDVDAKADALEAQSATITPRQRAHLAWLQARRTPNNPAATTLALRLCTEVGEPDLLAASWALNAGTSTPEVTMRRLQRALAVVPDDAPAGIRAYVQFQCMVFGGGPATQLERLAMDLVRAQHRGPGGALAVSASIVITQKLTQEGRWREAIEWAELGLARAVRPTLPRGMALTRRAALAVLERDLQRAGRLVEEATPLVQSRSRVRGALAMVLPHLGRAREALAILRSLRDAPDAPPADTLDLHEAFIAVHLGDLQLARERIPVLDATASPELLSSAVLLQHAVQAHPRVDDLEWAVGVYGADPDLPVLLKQALQRREHPWDAASMRIRALLHRTHLLLERHDELGRLRRALSDRPRGGPFPVGPFDLFERVGQGSFGVVYLGNLHGSGALAAVKLLHDERRGTELEEEASLVARLRHPHIAGVLDVGRLDPFLGALDPARFTPGRTWVAMEAVTGGTLEPWCGLLTWAPLRSVLVDLLAGIAHAHANGVLHLDLKPENVLLERTATGLVPKLADFGVASLLTAAAPGHRRVAGTPAYMAPEQWNGRPHELGPWTDLYAFGGLVWTLVTGAPPFVEPDLQRLAQQHRTAPRPSLRNPHPVPEGLEAWLHRLLDPDPSKRFPTAAAASRALLRLGSATRPADTEVLDRTEASTELLTHSFQTTLDPHLIQLAMQGNDPTEVPPHWPQLLQATSSLARPTRALAAHEGGPLHGLESAKQALWSALRRVGQASKPYVVWLEPPLGFQVRSLQQWLCHRAREAGLPSHVIDLDTDWPDTAVSSCVRRTSLRDADRDPMLRSRFPKLALGDLHPPSAALAARILRADLGLGPSVLVLRGTPDEDLIRSLALQPCLIVVEEACASIHQRIAVLPAANTAIVRTLTERIPISPALAHRIADIAGGFHDVALSTLGDLVEHDQLVRAGHVWELRPSVKLPPRTLHHPQRVMTRYLEASPDAALVVGAQLAGLPLLESTVFHARLGGDPARAEAALRDLGLLDRNGSLVPPALEAISDWLTNPDQTGLVRWIAALSEDPRHRSRVALRLGRPREAIDLLLQAASHGAPDAEALLQAAVDIVIDAAETELPGAYYLCRAKLLLHTDPASAQRYLLQATFDPSTAIEAHDQLSGVVGPYEAEHHLLTALELDPGNARFTMKLAVTRARQGHADEAMKLLQRACDADPTDVDLRYGLLGLTWRTAPDEAWLEDARAYASAASGNPALEPLAWSMLGTAAIQASRPELLALALTHLPDEHRALLHMLEAVAAADVATARAWLVGVHAAFLQTRHLAPVVWIWLAAEANEDVWVETLAQHDRGEHLLGSERWVIELAAARARDLDRREALEHLLER